MKKKSPPELIAFLTFNELEVQALSSRSFASIIQNKNSVVYNFLFICVFGAVFFIDVEKGVSYIKTECVNLVFTKTGRICC